MGGSLALSTCKGPSAKTGGLFFVPDFETLIYSQTDMAYVVTVNHEGGQVELEIDGVNFHPGNKQTRHYPGDPPSVEGFNSCVIKEDELGRDLDPEEVFDAHDDSILEQLLEKHGEEMNPKNRNLPGDWREGRRY